MSNRNQGFTLIELIVTLTILGIAVAIAVAAFGEVIERNRQEALKDEINSAIEPPTRTKKGEIIMPEGPATAVLFTSFIIQ